MMGKFACWCGYRLGGSPAEEGTAYSAIPDEFIEELLYPQGAVVASRRDAIAASAPDVFRCPNCGRLHWTGRDTHGRKKIFVEDTTRPRIWANFADRDELGRIVLWRERSLMDIRSQRLLLNPPLSVLLYGEAEEVPGVANYGISDTGELDESLWAVDLSDESKEDYTAE